MRLFFLVWLLSWTLGIAAGVAGVSGGRAAVLALFTTLAPWVLSRRGAGGVGRAPVAAGALVLGALGFVWAATHAPAAPAGTCRAAEIVAARVVSPVDERGDHVRFTAEAPDGCRWQVFASRWSGVHEGARIGLTGGRMRELSQLRADAAGYARYLERQGIAGNWQYPDLEVVEAGGEQRGWLLAAPAFASGKMRGRVTSFFIEPDASLVLAMLLAERGTLPKPLVDHFRAAGVSHVLAISGLHISLLAGMFMGIMLLLPIGPLPRTLIALAVLWAYIALIGAPASAVRAAAFWTVALAALRLKLLVSLPSVILLASGMMATVNPPYFTDVGWQLSVSAVAGIFFALYIARPLLSRIGALWRPVASAALVSLGASAATAPLIAYHFGNIATFSVAANLLVVPLVPVFLVLALGALLLSFLSQPLALLTAYALHLVTVWFDGVTGLIAATPGASLDVTVPLWFLPAYYAGLAAIVAGVLHWQRRRWREVWAP